MDTYRKQRNYGCRIHDQGTYLGMRTIVMENDKVRISILADKGTEIFEYLYKPLDLDFMWLSENGVQNPRDYVSTSSDPISNFIDYYPGGWQEIFPNGGPTSVYKGAQFGQHGEVAHMPWSYRIVEDSAERIQVLFSVRTKKVPFLLEKTLTLVLGSSTLTIEEKLENLSDVPLQYMWGQHLAFGKPFLEEGCQIIVPEGIKIVTEATGPGEAGRVARGANYEWPLAAGHNGESVDLSILPPQGTPTDIAYLTGFNQTGEYALENSRIGAGIQVKWDAEQFPYLWFWQEFGETVDYPWYGRHYNIGLEPFSSYPTSGLSEAILNGTAAAIEPKGRKSFTMEVSPYTITNSESKSETKGT
ncbi:DUF4432 family protein [Paenibacillus eucommiae]|uniref:Galactose mutarotase-like enzyme n=1 Tax=Paenibacillus eucommiae TaxID=1355755 RepID=A0ABS4IXX6_9BACL|nr:DUF4432 family protein [Paenibacillus eucommiae]MBP1992418.1 galactose mutarotase-like enzyme [Paenibacillus eucommiae]